MEVKQAMEVLRKIAKKVKIEDSETRVAIFEGLKALEKQIPKKVIKVIIPKGYGGISCRCPNCNSGNVDVKFCLECGQKLDW